MCHLIHSYSFSVIHHVLFYAACTNIGIGCGCGPDRREGCASLHEDVATITLYRAV